MRYRDSIAICLVFCLPVTAAAQTARADALFWQAAALELHSKDVPAAIRLYQQAVGQGHAPSMVRLGYLMQSGNGTPQDLPGAFTLYRQAAELGDLEGQFMYALCYAEGVGARKDPVTARKLMLPPAAGGHQFAQYALGIMIALGEGGSKGEAPARRWLDKAAAGKDRDLALKAAAQRDKIDKNLFSPDTSGAALFAGIAAFILLAGAMSGGGGGGGGMSSFPSSGMSGGGSSGSSGAPAGRTASPMNGDIFKTMHGADALGLGNRPIRMH
jgi:TPR repeat protein